MAATLATWVPALLAQVDPSGDWRTWRTPHFRVHARAEHANAAIEAAHEAERAYRLLTRELAPPRGVIDLVVADNVDLSNAFASVFPSNRLTVYATRPTGSTSLIYFDSWYRLVLTHELTHLFHLDRAEGVWAVLQRVFGRAPGLFPNAYQPSWVTEGLATYYESRFTSAGRTRGAFHRELLAAAARDARWPNAWDATFTSPRWPAGHRPYAWGGEFFRSAAARFGDSVVPRYVARTSGQWWPFLVSHPLVRAGGQGVESEWRRMRERSAGPVAGPSSGQTVVTGLRSAPHARVSPDGRWLALVRSSGKPEPRIVVYALADLREVASRRVNGIPDLAWLGDTLFATQLEFTSPVDVRSDLYRWPLGGPWERVTTGQRLAHPFAGPDGEMGAVRVAAGAREVVVWRGGTVMPLSLPPADAWARLASSPDGAWVAGARHHQGRWDIVLWPARRPTQVRAVTNDAALDADPVWSPDGRTLLFTSEREGFPQVYAYHPRDETLVRLTGEPTGAREPAPAPDGSLFVATLRGEGFALLRVRPRSWPVAAGGPPPSALNRADTTDISVGGFAPWPALRPHYWLPFGHDENASGVFLGAFTSGEDPIGRTAYVLAAAAAADLARFEGLLSLTHRRWKRVGLDVRLAQQWSSTLAIFGSGPPLELGERERRAELGLTWRWRRWRTALSARVSAEVKQVAYFDHAIGGPPVFPAPALAGGAVALQAAHWSRPPFAISPENGVVVDGLLRWRRPLTESGWSDEVRGGASAYLALPLPGFAHWVAAGRLAAGRTGGPDAEAYHIGGESGDVLELLPGYAVGSGRRTFPLRGYPRIGLFTRVAIGVGELRVPLFLVGRSLRKMPIVLDRVSLSLFGEVGAAWREGETASLEYRDVGGELVVDLGIVSDVPLRVRVGGAVPLRGVPALGVNRGDPRFYVAFGPPF